MMQDDKRNPIGVFLAWLIMVLGAVLFALITGCAKESTVTVQPLVVTEQSFDEWIAQDFKPVDPMTSYSSKDSSGDWTAWNKFWFAFAVGGQTADIISTRTAISRGCAEGNPLYGKDPSTGSLLLVKAGTLGLAYLITEYLLDEQPLQQTYRNWLYGFMAVSGFGVAGWNASLDCRN